MDTNTRTLLRAVKGMHSVDESTFYLWYDEKVLGYQLLYTYAAYHWHAIDVSEPIPTGMDNIARVLVETGSAGKKPDYIELRHRQIRKRLESKSSLWVCRCRAGSQALMEPDEGPSSDGEASDVSIITVRDGPAPISTAPISTAPTSIDSTPNNFATIPRNTGTIPKNPGIVPRTTTPRTPTLTEEVIIGWYPLVPDVVLVYLRTHRDLEKWFKNWLATAVPGAELSLFRPTTKEGVVRCYYTNKEYNYFRTINPLPYERVLRYEGEAAIQELIRFTLARLQYDNEGIFNPNEVGRRVYARLPPNTTKGTAFEVFRKFGKIEYIKVAPAKSTGLVAFICYFTTDAADKCLLAKNPTYGVVPLAPHRVNRHQGKSERYCLRCNQQVCAVHFTEHEWTCEFEDIHSESPQVASNAGRRSAFLAYLKENYSYQVSPDGTIQLRPIKK